MTGEDHITLKVTGMTCGHCARTVERHVKEVPGVLGAVVDLRGGTLRATIDAARADGAGVAAGVAAAVERAGYGVEVR